MVMKKTVILLILTLMMVVSGMCYAAGDGSDLNRQQKVADKFMAVLLSLIHISEPTRH